MTESITFIHELPPELFVYILELLLAQLSGNAFPGRYKFLLNGLWESYASVEAKIIAVSVLRRVSRQWKNLIEASPGLWTTIHSSLPTDVVTACIYRSSTRPLHVIFKPSTNEFDSYKTSFLDKFCYTRPRWHSFAAVLTGVTALHIKKCLEAPYPPLDNIVLMAPWPRHVGVIKLGPEQTKSLRHVELPTDAVEWAPSCFVKLLSLTLKGKKGTPEGPEGLTGDLLVGIIQASPELRELKLQDIDMEAAVPCPSITLLDLEFISLEGCSADLTEFILKLVQAPACAKVNLTLSPLQVVNISAVFGSCLRLLRGTLLKTHQGIRKSNISVNGDRVFRWTSPGFDADGTTSRGFRIAVIPVWQVCFQPCIEAVDQVFRNEISVELFLLCEPGYAERILRLIPPMESVKKVTLGSLLYSSEISNALRYLGEPAPPFPCLHEVKIATKRRDRDKPQEIYDSKFSVRRIPDTEH